MRSFLLAFALSLPAAALAPSTASAQPVTATLRAMLGHLPDPTGFEGATIDFGDMARARAVAAGWDFPRGTDSALAQFRGMPPGDLARSLRDPATDWRETVGFGPGDIAQVIALQAPPNSAQIIRLTPGVIEAVGPALQATGYALQTGQGVTAWARGEDHAMDMRNRNRDDPFDGGMGLSARVQIEGDLLRHARAWEMSAALADAASRPAAARPDIAALLDALDGAATDLPEAALIFAMLLPEAATLGLPPPFAMLTASDPPREDATPDWISAVLADLANGPGEAAVLAVSIALPDAATAEALRARIETAWAERPSESDGRSYGERLGVPARVAAHDAGGGLWVLSVTVETGAGEDRRRTLAMDALYSGAMRGDLVFMAP